MIIIIIFSEQNEDENVDVAEREKPVVSDIGEIGGNITNIYICTEV